VENNLVLQGKDFQNKDLYLTLSNGHQTFKTRNDEHVQPVWNQSFIVDINSVNTLEIKVFAKKFFTDKLIGQGIVSTLLASQHGEQQLWLPIMRDGVVTGQVEVQVSIADPPPKYVPVNGVAKLNQEYVNWAPENKTSLTKQQAPHALPVISSMSDYHDYNKASSSAGSNGTIDRIPHSVQESIKTMQSAQFGQSIGMSEDMDAIQLITPVFSKYEIPIGMLTKLLQLQSFECIQFLIDDSGSMGCTTDSWHPNGKPMTRWEEARDRMKVMFEIMAFVVIPPITIQFLNRHDIVELSRDHKHPHVFINEAWSAIDQVFSRGPSGGTPFYEKIAESFVNPRFVGRRTIRYFFGDGEPNGGFQAVKAIVQMVMNRERPQDNPITLVSCTNEDDQVEWMKQLEEAAPFTAEIDDFEDERREVLGDQGLVFPFTNGFYLIALIVGAMNPYDLDAMDESIPFTKYSLDTLLGVRYSDKEYFSYFDCFVNTQKRKPIQSALDRLKSGIDWKPYYNDFLNTQGPNIDIPVVVEFKKRIKASVASQQQYSSSNRY
jgi:hypothetical protein